MTAPPRLPPPWFHAKAMGLSIRGVTVEGKYRDLRPGETYVGPFVRPPFQRRLVWTRGQQVALIESLLEGFPIGAIVYNSTGSDDPCDAWLLDGQQRVTAMEAYVRGEFPVRGHLFTEVDVRDRRAFMMRPVAAQEARIASEARCRRVYRALATGGTAHAPDQYDA